MFYIPQNRQFRRCSSIPICWFEETKPNTTKSSNTGIKWSKLTQRTQKLLNWNKHMNVKLNHHANLRTVHTCAYHCAQFLYTIQHRTILINFPPNLQTITISLMLSIGGEWLNFGSNTLLTSLDVRWRYQHHSWRTASMPAAPRSSVEFRQWRH